jgi:hypothetical protein
MMRFMDVDRHSKDMTAAGRLFVCVTLPLAVLGRSPFLATQDVVRPRR